MDAYYITGTSRGLGKALAEKILMQSGNRVFGVSRTKTITHERYQHYKLDLGNEKAVLKFKFQPPPRLQPRNTEPIPSAGGGPTLRIPSPPGDSTLMTSAPRSPSIWVAKGPRRMVVRSTTLTPARGPCGLGRGDPLIYCSDD